MARLPPSRRSRTSVPSHSRSRAPDTNSNSQCSSVSTCASTVSPPSAPATPEADINRNECFTNLVDTTETSGQSQRRRDSVCSTSTASVVRLERTPELPQSIQYTGRNLLPQLEEQPQEPSTDQAEMLQQMRLFMAQQAAFNDKLIKSIEEKENKTCKPRKTRLPVALTVSPLYIINLLIKPVSNAAFSHAIFIRVLLIYKLLDRVQLFFLSM